MKGNRAGPELDTVVPRVEPQTPFDSHDTGMVDAKKHRTKIHAADRASVPITLG